MLGDNYSRRSVLKLLGSTGSGILGNGVMDATAGKPGHTDRGSFVKRGGKSFVRARTTSKPLSLRDIQGARKKFFSDFIDRSELNNDGIMLTIPERKPIVAYNLGVKDGVIKEFIGYETARGRWRRSRRLSTESKPLQEIHSDADAHLARISPGEESLRGAQNEIDGIMQTNTTDSFGSWNRLFQTVERESKTETGHLFTKVDCYRSKQSDVENDVYGIVSYADMGGGGIENVRTDINNWELTLGHKWAENTDMDFETRYPTSLVTGKTTESWGFTVDISWPPGGSASASGSYTQNNVQTYDESDPWSNIGKWRVSIDSDHTQRYTATVNPVSTADVDRTVTHTLPFVDATYQPVAEVITDATWWSNVGSFDTYRKGHSITIADQVEFDTQ